jgi:sugar phosphate isomerase/epimerase
MELCVYTDSIGELSFERALDLVAGLGVRAVEISAGGMSRAPHMRVRELLADAGKRAAFVAALEARELRLAAINCAAWPLHPVYGDEQLEVIRSGLRLAGELGVEKIVTMSGCPGESPHARTINWIAPPWTDEAAGILEEQWQRAVELWHGIVEFAAQHGVRRIALELLPPHLVYNVPTLLRLREAVGPVVGVNLDPSHYLWQRIDPLAAIEAFGPAVYHAHLKDVVFDEAELARTGVLDPRPLSDVHRPWTFRTVGQGRPAEWWRGFARALRAAGYDDVLSIENEDPLLPGEAGVREAVRFMRVAGV